VVDSVSSVIVLESFSRIEQVMKLSVYVKGEIFAIPCGDGTGTIKTLGENALKRYAKFKASALSILNKVSEIRRTNGGAMLDEDDIIKDVLNDDDFVSVGMYLL